MEKTAKSITMLSSYDEVDLKLFELAGHEQFIAREEAEMNSVIESIKKNYDQRTKEARILAKEITDSIELFLSLNKSDFEKNRTKSLTHGEVGFRFGTPKTQLLNRKYNWNTVLELLKKIYKKRFIRQVEEPNKEALIEAYNIGEIDDKSLAGIGLKIDKDEKPVVKINWENINKEYAT